MHEFSFQIVEAFADEITLEVKFTYPELFGQDSDNPEYISVYASFSDFEPGWDDELELIEMRIPKTKKHTSSAAAIESVGTAASSA